MILKVGISPNLGLANYKNEKRNSDFIGVSSPLKIMTTTDYDRFRNRY